MEISIISLQKKIAIDSFLSKKIREAVLETFEAPLIHSSLSKGERARARGKTVITICLTSNKEIRRFNKRFLHKDTSTDVIAFEMTGNGKTEKTNAEIIISADKAVSNARVFKTTPVYELLLYVIHGVLHVLGYDDRTKKQREIMHRREIKILNHVYP